MTVDLKAMFPTPEPKSRLVVLAQEWGATAVTLGADHCDVLHAAYTFFTHACDRSGIDPLYAFDQLLENNRGRINR